jgi:putative phage-type endonuclease
MLDVQTLQAMGAQVIDTRDIVQGSDEWHTARLGHITASHISDVMAKGKGKEESITRYKYKVKLVAERMTGVSASEGSFSSSAMEWGVEQEQFACIEYEAREETFLTRTGFWKHPTINWLGVSPDRLVGDGGLVEVKCPNTTTHLGYLFDKKVPTNYYNQIQCQLWVTGRVWCDFVSYDPRLPKRNQLLVVRVDRDDALIAVMQQEVKTFLDEIESLITKLGE